MIYGNLGGIKLDADIFTVDGDIMGSDDSQSLGPSLDLSLRP